LISFLLNTISLIVLKTGFVAGFVQQNLKKYDKLIIFLQNSIDTVVNSII